MRGVAPLLLGLQRIYTHAQLSAALNTPLPISTVVLRQNLRIRQPTGSTLEKTSCSTPVCIWKRRREARIWIGDDVVMSSGVHVVAMAGVTIGNGTIIGEYTSIRDANHNRDLGCTIRDSGHISKSITIGREVWLGRGVTILGGVTIGDRATIGANAVVTKDVSEGATVVGIPAAPINRGDLPASRVDKRSSFRY